MKALGADDGEGTLVLDFYDCATHSDAPRVTLVGNHFQYILDRHVPHLADSNKGSDKRFGWNDSRSVCHWFGVAGVRTPNIVPKIGRVNWLGQRAS